MWYLLSAVLLVWTGTTSGLRFPVIGDWGDIVPSGIAMQKIVAGQLSTWCGTYPCPYIWSTGDNFYEQGVMSPTDPRFDSSWRNIYNLPNINTLMWYISIGNHDHDSKNPGDGRELNQVLFGNTEPLWYFPDRWYDVVLTDPAGFSVHVVVIDSQSLRFNKNNPAAQLQWLDSRLAASTSEWKVVVSHHPPYSTGDHGPFDTTIDTQVVPICKNRGVHALVSGHEHNLEHIQNATNPNEIDYVISGGGGRGLYYYSSSAEAALQQRGLKVSYFGEHYGFVDMDFSATQLTVRYVDENGNTVYSFTRGRSTAPPRNT
jgi:hypothetical protein